MIILICTHSTVTKSKATLLTELAVLVVMLMIEL